jgi:hypothetical protein
MLHLLGVREVRWQGGGTKSAGEYIFFYGKGSENHELGTGFFVHKQSISAFKRVEFVSDRMPYIILRGRWCDIIVLKVHASKEDKKVRCSYIVTSINILACLLLGKPSIRLAISW